MSESLQFTLREWSKARSVRRHSAGMVLTISVFAYLGPFGTSSTLNSWELVVYWTAAIGLNWLLAMCAVPFTTRRLAQKGAPVWIGLIVGALASAIPGTGIVYLLEMIFSESRTVGFLYYYARVAVVFVIISFLVHRLLVMVPPNTVAQQESCKDESGRENHAFLDRLPEHLGRHLLHLRMQDHYVEAHTVDGHALILLRFRDALREIGDLDGRQVHRSHWVARDAVVGTKSRNGRLTLVLSNGAEVPVSRSHAPEIRAWLPT